MEERIITIATCPYSRAQLIKGKLEDEGIECFLSNVNLVQPDISAGVEIRIRENDADKGYTIVEELMEEYNDIAKHYGSSEKKIKKILVPVDFSEQSTNACNYALSLANKLKADIKLLHAYFIPVVSGDPYFDSYSFQFDINNLADTLVKEGKSQMKKLVTELKDRSKKEQFTDIHISSSLIQGIATDVILNYSDEYKPGLIVIGTRGTNPNGSEIIGSVTKKIIAKSTVPVFAIPQKSVYVGIKYLHRVLFATNYDESDISSMRKLMNLISPFEMKIYCVHIAADGDDPLDHAKMEGIKKRFLEEFSDTDIVCEIIEQDDVLQGLEDYIDEKDIDLIALTTHKRGMIERLFTRSLTRKMLFHSNVPLLVFHS